MSKNTYRAASPMIWIEDRQSGNTYVCPIGAVKDPDNPTSEELGQCVNESENPHNN